MKTKSEAIHILLDIGALDADEKVRDQLVGAITLNAPKSPLYKANAAIQAEVANVSARHTTYKSALGTAASSAKQHALDVAAANTARIQANKSIRLLSSLIEHDAVTEDDVKGMAMTPYMGKPPVPALVAPIAAATPGQKGSGKAKAFVQAPGKTRRKYAAESSQDGITWVALPGSGKARDLSGKSGTSIQVRFALQVRDQQSAWSDPVHITFP
jgi:hypothetical protein